ncbi:putative F-box protein At3g23950 [Primulina huaijiensis]|uniref:putative F-box protein At3g23950 n=1 Tax=Primulina huaijiensis TaxID=1492673 RepID=UPI003CC77952
METEIGSKRRGVITSTCGNFPEWMLFEVLIRLPVKVLFKFKIVSKKWFCMISDPSFARMYVARTSLLPHSQHWTLIHSRVDHKAATKQFLVRTVQLHECSLGTDCLQHRLILPRAQESDDSHYRIYGVSNGLVLYGPLEDIASNGRIYRCYICNLITGKWITLPPYEHIFRHVVVGFVTQVEDNILVSYRVVLTDSGTRFRACRFAVYFSETGKWVDFEIGFNQPIHFYWWKKAVVLDKILHRMTSGRKIMAYDPYNKLDSFRLLSLPGVKDEGKKMNITESLLNEHEGHLRFFVVASNEFSRSLIIWVLNDYDRGEWCLQHRVGISDIQSDGGLSLPTVPLSFHPSDQEIVYLINEEVILSYNIKTKTSKILGDSNKNYRCRFPFCHLYSFVIPTWPTSINSSSFEVTS